MVRNVLAGLLIPCLTQELAHASTRDATRADKHSRAPPTRRTARLLSHVVPVPYPVGSSTLQVTCIHLRLFANPHTPPAHGGGRDAVTAATATPSHCVAATVTARVRVRGPDVVAGDGVDYVLAVVPLAQCVCDKGAHTTVTHAAALPPPPSSSLPQHTRAKSTANAAATTTTAQPAAAGAAQDYHNNRSSGGKRSRAASTHPTAVAASGVAVVRLDVRVQVERVSIVFDVAAARPPCGGGGARMYTHHRYHDRHQPQTQQHGNSAGDKRAVHVTHTLPLSHDAWALEATVTGTVSSLA